MRRLAESDIEILPDGTRGPRETSNGIGARVRLVVSVLARGNDEIEQTARASIETSFADDTIRTISHRASRSSPRNQFAVFGELFQRAGRHLVIDCGQSHGQCFDAHQ